MKRIGRYLLLFIVSIWTLTILWVLTSLIPRTLIQSHSEESASYLLKNNSHYYNFLNGTSNQTTLLGQPAIRYDDCSMVDQIDDARLLSIALFIDPKHPLETSLWDNYYDGRNPVYSNEGEQVEPALCNTMNESLARVVYEKDVKPNQKDVVSWNGALVFIRPLLVFFNLREIKQLHYFILFGLLAALLIMLTQRGHGTEAVCLALALSFVSIWFVPLSLHYYWPFFITLIASLVAVKIKDVWLLFLLTGMVTAFLDSYTTGIITLLIPLLLTVRLRRECRWLFAIKSFLLWFAGFIGTMASKWGLVALVFGEKPDVGTVLTAGLMDVSKFKETIRLNVAMLFPFGYERVGMTIFVGMVIIGLIALIRRKPQRRGKIDISRILLYLVLGVLVYAWYAFDGQYFITYRAQAASVLALCFVGLEIFEQRKSSVSSW